MTKVKILKFSTAWCPPCQMLRPEIKKLRKKHPDWQIQEIDAEKEERKAAQYKISSVPTLIIFSRKKKKRITGYHPAEEVEKVINQLTN